jgi:hypothetical protein
MVLSPKGNIPSTWSIKTVNSKLLHLHCALRIFWIYSHHCLLWKVLDMKSNLVCNYVIV